MAHPPRIPVWLPLDHDVTYFITFCVAGRKPVLANREALRALERAVARLTAWSVDCAVLMPDHVHLLVSPHERAAAVGNCSGALKRWMRQDFHAQWQWQPGCFDRLLRSTESAQAKWEYIRENPVRSGLVKDWQEWPYRIGFREGL